MKLQDVYKHKKNNNIIQIDSFASRMNGTEEVIIVFNNLKYMIGDIGFCPSFNGFGTQEEIENEYELIVSQEELYDYNDWEEIFNKFKECEE